MNASRSILFSLGLLLLVFPPPARASVIFTEIMYDLSGTDTGREWIEITNTGESSIDASAFKLFEANSNHVLTLVSGNGILQSGNSAVIADDATKFKVDWPNFSGILFDSTFSLANAGESIVLKDISLTVLDSLSYDPLIGAGGDGNTLQWNGSAFVATTPTPGTYTSASHSSATTSSTSSTSAGGGTTTYVPPPSALSVVLRGPTTGTLEVPLRLSAHASTKSGIVDGAAQVSWSFGDGSSSAGTEVEKTYRYAGTYLVTVTASDGSARAQDELVVVMRKAELHLPPVSSDGITIVNDSDTRLDLSGWRILSDVGSFRIPEGMTILPKASVLFPFSITNLPFSPDATLVYPDGVIAARSVSPVAPAPVVLDEQPPVLSTSYIKVQAVEPIISVRESVPNYEEAVRAPAATTKLAAAGATVPTSSGSVFRSPWMLGLLSIVAIAGGAFILL